MPQAARGHTTDLLDRQPDLAGAHRGRRLPRPRPAAWRSASPARCCAPPACRWDLRKTEPYCGYETYDFDVPTATPCDAYGRFLVRLAEMQRVAEDRRAVPGPARARARSWSPTRRSPGRRSSRSAPTAWATRSSTSAKIMGQSMEALIHHFKLVTEGFRVPAGQVVRRPIESPRGELGVHVVSRRRHPAVPGALPRPVASSTCRPSAAMCEGGMVADVIAAVASHRPGHGWRGPLTMPTRAVRRATRERDADARSSPATRRPRSALLPMLHLVQSEEGYVSPDGHRVLRRELGLTKAEVARGRDLLHDVQAPPDRRLPRRRLHQHAVRGARRRRDLRRARASTSASATTRPPPTARSRSSTSSARRPATTRRS